MPLAAALLVVVPSARPFRHRELFKEVAGMSWAEITRRLCTSTLNLWRWRKMGVLPNIHHLLAMQDLADSMDLGYLLPTARVRNSETQI